MTPTPTQLTAEEIADILERISEIGQGLDPFMEDAGAFVETLPEDEPVATLEESAGMVYAGMLARLQDALATAHLWATGLKVLGEEDNATDKEWLDYAATKIMTGFESTFDHLDIGRISVVFVEEEES